MVEPWKRIEPTISTKIDYRQIIIKNFRLQDGRDKTYATIEAENSRSGAVVALTPDGKLFR